MRHRSVLAFACALGPLLAHVACSDDANSSEPPNYFPSGTFDAGSSTTPPAALCTIPMTKVESFEGRDIYDADLDLTKAPGSCAIRTSTKFRDAAVAVQIGYLAGSSGYSIDARPDYRITEASPGTVRPDGSAADVKEGDVVTFRIERRAPAETPEFFQDAGPAGAWRVKIRMNPDGTPPDRTDYSKWTLSLLSFEPG